ncbi:MAG: HAD-IB family hydrolase [Gammaproteobacteria bacterium]|nr:HAD-IB family hydrolase [Gammaproteobacteria bacterium]
MSKTLALFDFDATLTDRDSLPDFIIHAVGWVKYVLGLFVLSPILALYLLKLIRNDVAKEKMLGYFFKGWAIERFNAVGRDYALTRIHQIIRPQAIAQLQWHLAEGHDVVIVSASAENWLNAWATQQGCHLIATRMAVQENSLTGFFDGKNCYGQEKVTRICAEFDLSEYNSIYAYGDSSGDKPMLALADKAFYKPFRS